eukprot:GHVS01059632.1.p1 GENE.GHVS01059632.1~~GHVS01059632.1.p1  ORF type:complete len:176 (-),score=32.10 GHVS01059632.1:34-561(-)
MPCRVMFPVKLLLNICSYILFYVVLFQCLSCTVDSILLHLFGHIGILNNSLAVTHFGQREKEEGQISSTRTTPMTEKERDSSSSGGGMGGGKMGAVMRWWLVAVGGVGIGRNNKSTIMPWWWWWWIGLDPQRTFEIYLDLRKAIEKVIDGKLCEAAALPTLPCICNHSYQSSSRK